MAVRQSDLLGWKFTLSHKTPTHEDDWNEVSCCATTSWEGFITWVLVVLILLGVWAYNERQPRPLPSADEIFVATSINDLDYAESQGMQCQISMNDRSRWECR